MSDKEASIEIPISAVVGGMLVRIHDNHPRSWFCMECGEDTSRCPAVDIINTTEVCTCATATYSHLIGRSHHKECYTKMILAQDTPQ